MIINEGILIGVDFTSVDVGCYISKRHANCLVLAIDSPWRPFHFLEESTEALDQTLEEYCLLGVHFQCHSTCRSTQLNISLRNVGTVIYIRDNNVNVK